jgi:hypothetical protein
MDHQCLCCGAGFMTRKSCRNMYCNNQCQMDFQYKVYVEQWLRGEQTGYKGSLFQLSSHVRRYLRETRGTACSQCGWDGKHPTDGASVTEVDHIDGDAANCVPDNLRILCPNCHSLTPTFRARNKQSSRTAR